MNSRLFNVISVMLCTVVLGVGLNAHRLAELLDSGGQDQVSLPSAKAYTHLIAEGLSLQSGALPGVELVRFDSCRIEKQHRSGFSLGGFNVLAIDNLKLVLPPQATAPEGGAGPLTAYSGSPSDSVKAEIKKLLAVYPRFSALEIRGLSVSLVGADGQQQNVLKATSAEAGRHKTLELSHCEFLSSAGSRVCCGAASLSLEPPYLISTGPATFQVAGLHGSREFLLAQVINQ